MSTVVTFPVAADLAAGIESAKELIQTLEEGSNQGITNITRLGVFTEVDFNMIDAKGGRKIGILQQSTAKIKDLYTAAGKTDVDARIASWAEARPLVRGIKNLDGDFAAQMNPIKKTKVELVVCQISAYPLSATASETSKKIHSKHHEMLGKWVVAAIPV